MIYVTLGLLGPEGLTFLNGGEVFLLMTWKRFKLGSKGERNKIRLTGDKLWGGRAMFEGWCASEGFHSAP